MSFQKTSISQTTQFVSPILTSIGDSSTQLISHLLVTLLALSISTHLITVLFYPNVLSSLELWIAFSPTYFTIVGTYIPLKIKRVTLAIHFFLLGMIAHQMLVVLFLTGPATYVYVSYTNVVLVAGLILGPMGGLTYTGIILLLVSSYFYSARMGYVDTQLIQNIKNGEDLVLFATLACFVFTGTAVSYSVIKMASLYQNSLIEQERSSKALSCSIDFPDSFP